MIGFNKFGKVSKGMALGLAGLVLYSSATFGEEKNFTFSKKQSGEAAESMPAQDGAPQKHLDLYEDIKEELQKKLSEISDRTGYSKQEITDMGIKTLGEIGRLPTHEDYLDKRSSLWDDIRSKKETRDKVIPFADNLGNKDGETILRELYNASDFLFLLESKLRLDYISEHINEEKPKSQPKEKQGSLGIGETIEDISYLLFNAFLSSQMPSQDELREYDRYREDNNVSHYR